MDKYDAFISYHHSEYDSWVAKQIHKYIEHYHIPRAIQMVSGKKKFERIFRDKEELQLSADLTHEIYQVLEKAEFLIVICSPESKNSLWVNKEVEYFLKFHDQDRVFPVLTEGEAETSFPNCIMHDEDQSLEHLAADFRHDKKKFTRYMKTEMLRIISRMLCVSFDALKQRHRAYRRMQLSVAASIALTAIAIFAATNLYQRHQLNLENRTRLTNQAEYAAEKSLTMFREGDKKGALEEALSIRDPDDPEKLMSPYQTYALNTALSSYVPEEIDRFVPGTTVGSTVSDGEFSENGTYYYTADSDGYISCYSVKNQTLLWTMNSATIDERLDPIRERFSDYAKSSINSFKPYGDTRLLLICDCIVVIVDATSGEITDLLPIEFSTYNSFDIQGNLFIVSYHEDIYIYDLTNGKETAHIPVFDYITTRYGEEGYEYSRYYYPTYSLIKANTDATKIAFCIPSDKLHEKTVDSERIETPYPDGLYIYDQADQSIHCLAEKTASDVLFIDDQVLAAMHSENAEKVFSTNFDYRKKYYTSVYDLNSFQETMQGESVTVTSTAASDMIYKKLESADGLNRLLISYVFDRVFILNLDTGEPVAQLGYDAIIQSLVDWGEKSFLVSTKLGWAQSVILNDSIKRVDIMNLSKGQKFTDVSKNAKTIACCRDGRVTFYEGKYDAKMLCSEYPHKNTYDLLFETYHHSENEDYFLYYGSEKNGFTYVYLCVFNAAENKAPLYEYTCCNAGDAIKYYKYFDMDGEAMLVFAEHLYKDSTDDDSNEQVKIHLVHLASGKETILGMEDNSISSWSLSKNQKGYYLIYANIKKDHLVQLYLEEDQIADTVVITPKNDLFTYSISGDGEYIYIITNDDKWTNNLIYDCNADQFYTFDKKVPRYKKYSELSAEMSIIGHTLCLYDKKSFYLIDCSSGETLLTIPYVLNGNRISYSFFNQDQYLLTCDNNSILLYDLTTGNFIDSYSFMAEDGDDYELRTGDSAENFMVFQGSVSNQEIHGETSGKKWLFSVDKNLHMLPIAQLRFAFIDFSCQKIIIPMNGNIYTSDYYTQEELMKEAEAIVGTDTESDVEIMENPNFFGSTGRFASRAFSNKKVDVFAEEDTSTEENEATSAEKDADVPSKDTGRETDSAPATEIDYDEYNFWDFSEKTERVEAKVSADSYRIALSEEDSRMIRKVIANIYVKTTENEVDSFYPVLTGRQLYVADDHTLTLQKNPEILTLHTDADGYIPLYFTRETVTDGQRSWISGKAAFKQSQVDTIYTQKYGYLHSEEKADGSISYVLRRNLDGDEYGPNTRAYLNTAKTMLSYSLAASTQNQYALSGATMPETILSTSLLQGTQFSIDDPDSLELVLKPVSEISKEWMGQICIYYEDGSIQTTDFLPLEQATESRYQKITMNGVQYDVSDQTATVDKLADDLENIEITEEIDGLPVTYIYSSVSHHLDSVVRLSETVKSISIPASVEKIDPGVLLSEAFLNVTLAEGQTAFKLQDNLLMTMDGKRILAICSDPGEDLVIPEGVEVIDPYVFCNCKTLKRLVLPDSLKTIGKSAFYNCPLTDLELPEGLEFLGDYAFFRFRSSSTTKEEEWIQKDTFRIGKALYYLGIQALDSLCVKNFEVAPQNSMYQSVDGVIYSKDMRYLFLFPSARGGSFTVPDGVEFIIEYAFYNNGAFANVIDDTWGITELILSDSVKHIQKDAFNSYNNDIRTIKAGQALEYLGDAWHYSNLDLTGKTSIIKDRYGNYYNEDRSILLHCNKDAKEYTFLKSVRTIDSYAFQSCSKLQRILIPAEVNLDPDSAESFITDSSVKELESIEVENGNPDFSSVTGKLFSASGLTFLGKED